MGINGLLGLISPAMKDSHLEQFRGKVVAVDAMCWFDSYPIVDTIGCIVEVILVCGNCLQESKPLGTFFA